MNIELICRGGAAVAVVTADEPVLTDVQSALDLMAQVQFEHQASRIAIAKSAVAEDFFILSTRLAGEVLQKFVNYRVKFAIFGDFSRYTSKPLRDFIRESNAGWDVFFAATREEAVERLLRV
ncbi:MAG TPA: DUF4180 domain-containing protein [Clostridia bacterium]|nr:DUF4180 domain-containing protein [Clostridia bacterium]